MLQASGDWAAQFGCGDARVLIICRGPVRMEAMEVFARMGADFGILLSERDSLAAADCLAPELRRMDNPQRVHLIEDYSAPDAEGRQRRVAQIIEIAASHGYNAIFAGYGFMAEDPALAAAVQAAGLHFLGPSAAVMRAAGPKDRARRTAASLGISTVPGSDDLDVRALLAKAPDCQALLALGKRHRLRLGAAMRRLDDPAALAQALLGLARERGLELVGDDELAEQVAKCVAQMQKAHPRSQIRLKAASGGGGKGQRLVPPAPAGGPASGRAKKLRTLVGALVREALAEAGGERNIIVELNLQHTRHQEIQVVGNGDWCLALGGRDCSVQRHDQKLLELSLTTDELDAAIARARDSGDARTLRWLRRERRNLHQMEQAAMRFGGALGLDSLSTFECMVVGNRHYFMEMNTRIQVEHRITELCYGLRFECPDDGGQYLEVHSLVALMLILALHGARLPMPRRVARRTAALEVRLNATDDALMPSSGGLVEHWSAPVDGELRDDQGICLANPSTGMAPCYRLTGAYDSNMALLISAADGRAQGLWQMAEILRRTEISGAGLATNLDFHYGLVSWLIEAPPWMDMPTDFVGPWLCLVGALHERAGTLDLDELWRQMQGRSQLPEPVWNARRNLLLRPLRALLARPHLLAGWVAHSRAWCDWGDGGPVWKANPLYVLERLYHYLNMEVRPGRAAAHCIWAEDAAILQDAEAFYQGLKAAMGVAGYSDLRFDRRPPGHSKRQWDEICRAHEAHQVGNALLALPAMFAEECGFWELRVRPGGDLRIPARLRNAARQRQMQEILAPPPQAQSADEVVAPMGGMFYAREVPSAPVLAAVGQRLAAGDTLCLVEAMKMFNRVAAPRDCVIKEVLAPGDGGTIARGQPLFLLEPSARGRGRDAPQARPGGARRMAALAARLSAPAN